MTETAMTAETATVASWCCILRNMQKEGKVLSRTAKTVMKATPLKLKPPFSDILKEEKFQISVPLWIGSAQGASLITPFVPVQTLSMKNATPTTAR